MAKKEGINGWSRLRKDELIRALLRVARAKARKSAKKPANHKTKASLKSGGKAKPAVANRTSSPSAKNLSPAEGNSKKQTISARSNGKSDRRGTNEASTFEQNIGGRNGHVFRGTSEISRKLIKDLSAHSNGRLLRGAESPDNLREMDSQAAGNLDPRDRLVLMVRDSYWLHSHWTICRASVERAKAAMAEHWHVCRPVLRLMVIEESSCNTSERVERDIEIHGGVNNWYIDVYDPPQTFRAVIGYLADIDRFYGLARSNIVSTPAPDSTNTVDENWLNVSENYERIFAMSGGYSEECDSGELQELFEERLRRPMDAPSGAKFGEGAERILKKDRDFRFDVDAELIIFGATKPNARVTLGKEPVKLRADGTFTVRQSMPDRRQVLPIVARSSDGVEQRTVILAIERNTKVMEPLIQDPTP